MHCDIEQPGVVAAMTQGELVDMVKFIEQLDGDFRRALSAYSELCRQLGSSVDVWKLRDWSDSALGFEVPVGVREELRRMPVEISKDVHRLYTCLSCISIYPLYYLCIHEFM